MEGDDSTTPPEPQTLNTVNSASQGSDANSASSHGEYHAPEMQNTPKSTETLFNSQKLDLLHDVNITISIEIGRAQMKIRDLLSLSPNSIIELNKLAGDPVDIYANGKCISKGTIITANGKYCVKLGSINENVYVKKSE
jgi:flagellar motor switch protein FliN/FliY